MPYALLLNTAISLIIGIALVLVWRRDRTQSFTLYIGLSNLVQMLVPLSYWLTAQSGAALPLAGLLLFPPISAIYSTLLVVGCLHLANRPLSLGYINWTLSAILVMDAAALGFGGKAIAVVVMAIINTLIGVVCTYWLWATDSTRAKRHNYEKLVGPLLLLLGLIQFIYVAYGNEGTAWQATLGSLLRVILGLVLMYAALDRGRAAARKLQTRFERLAEYSYQGILVSLPDRSLPYANPACLAMYGVRTLAELTANAVRQTMTETERQMISTLLDSILNGERHDASYDGIRTRQDGSQVWLRFHCFRTEWDNSPAVQMLISDETERHQAHQALLYQARHDELTGLPNRTALLEALKRRCRSNEEEDRFVLVLMNVDRFKLFNEAHGHHMGDDVLKALSQGLRSALDASVDIMRLGGDEFALVSAAGGSGETAVAMVATVRQLLGKPLPVHGMEIFLDASMGIALYPNSGRDASSLLRAANAAMHVAKRTPGTSHRLAEKAFERGSSNALEQEQALRAGIERSEFHLVFQPKVNAQTGQLTSFEALARWNRPVVGPVSPVEFIAAAERTGLISILGTALLKQACQQIALWQAQYGDCVPVAVNVSPLQLLDPRFPQLVAHILKTSGVEAQWLTLEITESSAVQNLDQTVAQVAQLRAMGVHVAMDDFGTGFSSLNMLRTLRLHTIKIDRGLIDPLPAPEAIAVVRAICQLAKALHLHVVAEGVETHAQADAARDAGCDELQGYLYSKPLLSQDCQPWLAPAPTSSAQSA